MIAKIFNFNHGGVRTLACARGLGQARTGTFASQNKSRRREKQARGRGWAPRAEQAPRGNSRPSEYRKRPARRLLVQSRATQKVTGAGRGQNLNPRATDLSQLVPPPGLFGVKFFKIS